MNLPFVPTKNPENILKHVLKVNKNSKINSIKNKNSIINLKSKISKNLNVTYNSIRFFADTKVPPGSTVFVSLSKDMQPLLLTTKVSPEGKISFPLPISGKVFWKIPSEKILHTITVIQPKPLKAKFMTPSQVGAHELITWTGDERVSYYILTVFNTDNLSEPENTYTTNQTSFNLKTLGPGHWKIELQGLNSQSGLKEHLDEIVVTVLDHLQDFSEFFPAAEK